ncbi:MAG: hypothetical protein DCC51_12055 [Anaerolineae bacterium]|nr:MAG: hypothetical protein DCC51_12055 [Anaerolineae bacterium]
MKRIGLLLILMILFAAGCGSNATNLTEQFESEEPSARATAAPDSAEPAGGVAGVPSGDVDDPTQARERDWKEGNTVNPAVTIIEYGDFQ